MVFVVMVNSTVVICVDRQQGTVVSVVVHVSVARIGDVTIATGGLGAAVGGTTRGAGVAHVLLGGGHRLVRLIAVAPSAGVKETGWGAEGDNFVLGFLVLCK